MPNQRKKVRYVCEYEGCSSSFRRLDRLKSHSSIHENERPFICCYDDCDKSYTQVSHLKRHQETHKGNFRCTEDNCDKTFISTSTLKKHIDNIHLKKKPKTYKCSYCDQEFNKHSWLARHEFRHTDIKPYLCPKENCEKRFLLPSKLKRHLKVHEGYTCAMPNCNETFTKWTLYVKHLKVDHPKIYKCHHCEKEFSTRNNLKAHMEVHCLDREVFLCTQPNCSRFYFMKRNLTHHIKSYHEKRPFICTTKDCHKAFKSEAALNAHLTRHDPDKPLRKKKKKRKPKPSFAAVLAGCERKVLHNQTKETELGGTKETELQKEKTYGKEESNSNLGILEKEKDICSTNNEEDVKCGEYEDLQTLLSMINVRSMLERKSTSVGTECVSIVA